MRIKLKGRIEMRRKLDDDLFFIFGILLPVNQLGYLIDESRADRALLLRAKAKSSGLLCWDLSGRITNE